MKIGQKIVKIGPENKKVDFSEGVLAAEGGEQAILKMGVIIYWDIYGAIYRVYMAIYMIYMLIYDDIYPKYSPKWPKYDQKC